MRALIACAKADLRSRVQFFFSNRYKWSLIARIYFIQCPLNIDAFNHVSEGGLGLIGSLGKATLERMR